MSSILQQSQLTVKILSFLIISGGASFELKIADCLA